MKWEPISRGFVLLGKFPKSFLTLLPPLASSVNCQNITLASDSKGIEVVSHLSTADSSVWKLQAGSGCCNEGLKPCTGQRQGALEGGSEHCPTLLQIFHPALLARMSEGAPTQELGHWGITFCLLEIQELQKNHLKTNCLSEMGW